MDRKINSVCILVFLLLIPASLFAQSNFVKGRVITLTGDTLAVQINDQNWLSNPERITFKINNSSEQSFRPSEIKAAVVDSGDYFLSAIIHLDRNYSKTITISEVYSRDISTKDTVFLRVLLKGTLSLYLFTDENTKDHFFLKSDKSDFIELIYKKIPQVVGDKTYTYTDSKYKEQLKIFMRQCSSVRESKIDNTDYSEKSLLGLFKEYNQCLSGSKIEYISQGKINHASFNIIVGLDIAQLGFKGADVYNDLERGNFSKSYRPILGIRIILPISRLREKYSLVSDLTWRQYNTSSHYEGDFYNEYNIHFKTNYLKLNVAFRYKYASAFIQPYAISGFTVSYLLNFTNEKYQINHNPFIVTNKPRESYGEAINGPSSFDFGFFGGIGVRIKRFGFESQFEHSKGFSLYGGLTSPVHTFYFLISFRLSKSN